MGMDGAVNAIKLFQWHMIFPLENSERIRSPLPLH